MFKNVSTLAVEWIEIILSPEQMMEAKQVSTLAVEWIEIQDECYPAQMSRSPPSRWSGLKYPF